MRRLLLVALAGLLLTALSPVQRGVLFTAAPSVVVNYTGVGDAVSGWAHYWALDALTKATRGNAVVNVCDAQTGTTNCADWDSSTSTGLVVPTVLPGGHNCTTSPPCYVQTIYDQGSGATNMTTATNERPEIEPNCGGSGQWGMFFISASSLSASTSSSVTSAQSYNIVLVAERTSNFTTYQEIWGDNTAAVDTRYANAANKVEMQSASLSAQVTASDSTLHVLQSIFNGASSVQAVDSTQTTVSPGTTGLTNTGFALGRLPAADNYLDGCVMVFGVNYNGQAAFTGTQMTSVYNALNGQGY